MKASIRNYFMSLEEDTLAELLKETIYPELVKNSDEEIRQLLIYV